MSASTAWLGAPGPTVPAQPGRQVVDPQEHDQRGPLDRPELTPDGLGIDLDPPGIERRRPLLGARQRVLDRQRLAAHPALPARLPIRSCASAHATPIRIDLLNRRPAEASGRPTWQIVADGVACLAPCELRHRAPARVDGLARHAPPASSLAISTAAAARSPPMPTSQPGSPSPARTSQLHAQPARARAATAPSSRPSRSSSRPSSRSGRGEPPGAAAPPAPACLHREHGRGRPCRRPPASARPPAGVGAG